MGVRATVLALLTSVLAVVGPGSAANPPSGGESALSAPHLRIAGSAEARPPGAVLTQQTATLTQAHRAPGWPTTSEPGRQLSGARIEVDLRPDQTRDWLDATVDLAAPPTPSPGTGNPDDILRVGYGHRSGTTCNLAVAQATRTDVDASRYHLLNWVGEEGYGQVGERPATPFDCVAVYLSSSDDAAIYDVLLGSLVNTWEAPRLKVGGLSQLGDGQKQLKLVRGTWTPYSVEVANTGERPVGSVVLTGRGAGVRVRRSVDGHSLAPGRTTTISFEVKLTSRTGRARVSLTADAGAGVTASRRFAVRRVKAPKRLANGTYRSRNGRVSFKVHKGRVVGFRARTETRCGTDPVTQNTYDFPRTRIPVHGVVSASQKGSTSGGGRWTAHLSFRAQGNRATSGSFKYFFYIPGLIGSNCSASESFAARRTGR